MTACQVIRLGDWHGVEPERVLPASGGSEAIRRLTLAAMLSGVTRVCVPRPGFGDYAHATTDDRETILAFDSHDEC